MPPFNRGPFQVTIDMDLRDAIVRRAENDNIDISDFVEMILQAAIDGGYDTQIKKHVIYEVQIGFGTEYTTFKTITDRNRAYIVADELGMKILEQGHYKDRRFKSVIHLAPGSWRCLDEVGTDTMNVRVYEVVQTEVPSGERSDSNKTASRTTEGSSVPKGT